MDPVDLSAVWAAHGVAVAYLFGSRRGRSRSLPQAASRPDRRADQHRPGQPRHRCRRTRVPRDDGDAFRVLAEVGVLEAGLAGRMVSLTGARSLIVHLYAEVDDERLAGAVRDSGLDDLSAFAAAVAALADPEITS